MAYVTPQAQILNLYGSTEFKRTVDSSCANTIEIILFGQIIGYSYEIIYKWSAQNKIADALSRIHNSLALRMTITTPR